MTASARFDNSPGGNVPILLPLPATTNANASATTTAPATTTTNATAPAPALEPVPSAWLSRRGAWTPRRVWLAWLFGHAVLVVPLAWAYAVDGYDAVPYDVRIYAEWGASLAAGDGLPAGDDRWQYPPGAAVVFALPAVADRLVGLPYPAGFVGLTLLVSAAVTVVLLRRRSTGAAGLWTVGVWAVGQVAVARFDLVPAAFAVLALVSVNDRRWGRAGWASGAGALAKAWPVVALAALGRVRRNPGTVPGPNGSVRRPRDFLALGGGLAGAVAVLGLVAVAAGWWRDVLSFLGAQQARGLQLEAVAATPLVLSRAFGGGGEAPVYAYGSMQFGSPFAQAVATGCSVAGAVVVVAAVVWWWGTGRVDGSTVADRCFLLMVLLVVTARVLSPQYLLWLLAVAACRPNPWGVGGSDPPWRRPAVLLLAAALLSQLVYPMTYDGLLAGDLLPSLLLAARNGLLVVLCAVAFGQVGGGLIRAEARRAAPAAPKPSRRCR